MKNMKISAKLITGFALVAVIAAIVGAVGIFGMSTIDNSYTKDYELHTSALPYLTNSNESMLTMRIYLREYLLRDEADWGEVDTIIKENYDNAKNEMTTFLNDKVTLPESEKLCEEFFACIEEYYSSVEVIKGHVRLGDMEKARGDDWSTALKAALRASEIVQDFLETKLNMVEESSDANSALSNTLLIVMIAVLIIGIVVAIILGIVISKMISKPILPVTSFMDKAGNTGDLSISQEDMTIISKYAQNKDETGTLIASTNKFVNRIQEIEKKLEIIAGGDFTEPINKLSDKDSLATSVNKMLTDFNAIFGEINTASAQVNSGGIQVSGAAQALSQGATEQASAIEELSASIHDISEQVKDNSANANRANELVNETHNEVQRGNEHMTNMLNAMTEINSASSEISKIIKVIDDIAFQTNILALNAAVEAARAGSAGKGFAVVAEEVRNLASKSADAAKHTTELIEGSIASVEKGASIAQDTARSLEAVAEKTKEVQHIVTDIATASTEQAEGIRQINTGVDQISQVVQTNSATAEESAAASEQLSSQANLLQDQISKIKLDEHTSMGLGNDW